VVEEHDLRAGLGERRADLLGLAAADVQAGIGTRPMTEDAAADVVAGGRRERRELVERGAVDALATQRDADQQARVVGDRGGGVQLSGLSCWKLTARAGTTVEIACL
jgi:hypothetical protein